MGSQRTWLTQLRLIKSLLRDMRTFDSTTCYNVSEVSTLDIKWIETRHWRDCGEHWNIQKKVYLYMKRQRKEGKVGGWTTERGLVKTSTGDDDHVEPVILIGEIRKSFMRLLVIKLLSRLYDNFYWFRTLRIFVQSEGSVSFRNKSYTVPINITSKRNEKKKKHTHILGFSYLLKE